MVELPGTVIPSSVMTMQDSTAAGIAAYAVTWHASEYSVADGNGDGETSGAVDFGA